MTISTTENKVSYEGNGALTEFTFLFKVLSVGHIKVYLDDALQGSGYTVNLNPDQNTDPGGSVDFDIAPADGATVTLLRSVPIDQLVDYTPYDPFPAETHEGALDKLTMIAQQQQEELDRTIQFPPSASLPDRDAGEGLFPPYNAGKGLMWSETEPNVLVNSNDNLNGIIEDCEDARDEAIAAKDRAVLAETRAVTAANNAEQSEINAKASEDAAFSYQEGAYERAVWAHNWAAEEVDVPVNDTIHPQGYSAYHWATKAIDNAEAQVEQAWEWAQQAEDVPVTDDNHIGFSAYHWALKSSAGGVVEIRTNDPEIISVNNSEVRIPVLEIHSNVANGLLKLNANNKVPLEQMPIQGLNFVGLYRGDDNCPKAGDDVDCNEPDYRNPTERWPNAPFSVGDFFIIRTDGNVNLVNPDTGIEEITPVLIKDGIVLITGVTDFTDGWYKVEGMSSSDTVLASDVVVDDSNMTIKGINQQLWDEAADTAITGKYDKTGGDLTGNLTINGQVVVGQVDTTAYIGNYTANGINYAAGIGASQGGNMTIGTGGVDGTDATAHLACLADGTTIFNKGAVSLTTEGTAAGHLVTKGYVDIGDAVAAAHIADMDNPHGVTPAQIGAANATDLTDHIGDMTNPHGVTAAQIGAVTSSDNSVRDFVTMSQSEYDALGAYVATTIYFVYPDPE